MHIKNQSPALSRYLSRHRLGYCRTLECLGAYHAPLLLSREPLVVESRARRHSKALDKTLQNHLSELKIEVTCEFKVRSKVKIRRLTFWALGTRIMESDGSNQAKCCQRPGYGMV